MAKLVTEQESNSRLWLVGDGPYREECLQIAAKLRIGDKVKFVGSVPRGEVDKYYAASDLFTFASVTETQGLVLNEAMQYGIPAVAVDGGGATEAIIQGENGFAVKNHESLLASQVLTILRNETLYDHLCLGATQSAANNTSEIMSAKVLEVYQAAINQPKVPYERKQPSLII